MRTRDAYVIRPATRDDASQVSRLIAGYGAEHNTALDAGAVECRTVDLLAQCLAEGSHTAYVAVTADNVVGYAAVHWIPFIWLQGTEGYISELLVNADHRGRGVGRQLMAEVEREARGRACFRLMLNNFREQESYRRGFYTKLGFVQRDAVGNFVKSLDKEPQELQDRRANGTPLKPRPSPTTSRPGGEGRL